MFSQNDTECVTQSNPNPRELYVAVGDSGILSVAQVVGAINVVSQNAEIVGLTIAEHLPKAQIELKEMLKKLPLIKGD